MCKLNLANTNAKVRVKRDTKDGNQFHKRSYSEVVVVVVVGVCSKIHKQVKNARSNI